jgi:hypothetical protein
MRLSLLAKRVTSSEFSQCRTRTGGVELLGRHPNPRQRHHGVEFTLSVAATGASRSRSSVSSCCSQSAADTSPIVDRYSSGELDSLGSDRLASAELRSFPDASGGSATRSR